MAAEYERIYDRRRAPGVTGLMEAFWEQVQKDLGQGYRTRVGDKGTLEPKRARNGKYDAVGSIAVSTFAFVHSADFDNWLALCGADDADAVRAHYLSKYWTGPIPRR